MRRVMVAGLALGVFLGGAASVEAFGFGNFNKFRKVQRNINKVKETQAKIDKARKLFSDLSGGMKGIRERLQKKILGNKRVSKILNKLMGEKEKFRQAWDGEMGSKDKHKLLGQLLSNRRALAALGRGNFKQAFQNAKVKLPKLLQPLQTGEATNLAGALRVSAMKKLEAKGISPAFLKGLRGKLNINAMAYFALRKNKKYGSAFQNAYEGGGGFRQVLDGMVANQRNSLIQKLSKNGKALEKFQGGAWGSALQLVGVQVPNIPGVTPAATEAAVAEEGEGDSDGSGDEEGYDESSDEDYGEEGEDGYDDTGEEDYGEEGEGGYDE